MSDLKVSGSYGARGYRGPRNASPYLHNWFCRGCGEFIPKGTEDRGPKGKPLCPRTDEWTGRKCHRQLVGFPRRSPKKEKIKALLRRKIVIPTN